MSDFIVPPMPLMGDDPLAALLDARADRPGVGPGRGLEEAARGFESMLLHRLVGAMKQTIPESGLLDAGGIGGQVRDLFWFYLAEEMGRRGGLGLARQLCRRFAEAAGLTPERPAPEPAP